jgi:hypothetical protein
MTRRPEDELLAFGVEEGGRAAAFRWTTVENAASKSLSALARTTTSCTPRGTAASCTSRNWFSASE